jgi:predicted metal-binding protein
MDSRERWACFFRYYGERKGLIEEIERAEEGIAMAEQVVLDFTETELERLREDAQIKFELDAQEELFEMKEDARNEGLA